MQAAIQLGMCRLELVADFSLGPPGDLAPEPLPFRSEADRDRTDVAVLRRVEVDRVLAVPATARNPFGFPRREPVPGRGSELVVRGRVELPTFRFSGGRSYQLSYLTWLGPQ